MKRSSFVVKAGLLALLLAGSVACGGGEKPPAQPEAPGMADGGETPPAPAAPEADAGAPTSTTAPETPAPAPAPAALALPSASAKVKGKTTKDIDIELKSDGTVHSSGKPAAKINGMELQDPAGKTQLKVESDGTITTADGAAYAKFDGDTLTTNTGVKYAIADDGSLMNTPEKGAEKSVGKATDVGSAKRSALLAVAFMTWGTKAPQPKVAAAKPGAAGEKTAATEKAAASDKKAAADKPKK